MTDAAPDATAPPPPRLLDARWVNRLPIIALLTLFAGLGLPRVRSESGLTWAIFAAGLFAGGWVLAVVLRARTEGRALEVEWRPRAPHVWQFAAHCIVYGYWAAYHDGTVEQLALIALQIPFAYLMEMAVGWKRYGRFRLGFGPLPVIGSINLFLWMVDAWFIVQFAMVAFAYLSREWFQWTVKGRRRHIFNPSAIALVAVSVVLIATDSTTLARGKEIAVTLGYGPLCYLSIFAAGLLVQALFPVVLVTLSAVGINLLFGAIWTATTGTWYYIDTAIPVAVFLGMTLLVTDPVTSPGNAMGKVIFGALYGASVFGLYTLLEIIGGGPLAEDITYFDKLLAVPVLNLMAPALHRLGARLTPTRLAETLTPRRWHWAHIAVYIAVFFAARPALLESPGRQVEPWVNACFAGATGACDRLAKVYDNRCLATGAPAACARATPLVLPAACEAQGLPTACALYGQMLITGANGLPADPRKARKVLAVACDAGRPDACGQLGLLLWKGTGGPIDTADADRKLAKACDADIPISCEQYAQMVDEIAQPGSRYRPLQLYEKACDLGRSVSCATAGLFYAQGTGVHVDVPKAISFLDRACRDGLAPACRLKARLEAGEPP